MICTHFPNEQTWQLLIPAISKLEFEQLVHYEQAPANMEQEQPEHHVFAPANTISCKSNYAIDQNMITLSFLSNSAAEYVVHVMHTSCYSLQHFDMVRQTKQQEQQEQSKHQYHHDIFVALPFKGHYIVQVQRQIGISIYI